MRVCVCVCLEESASVTSAGMPSSEKADTDTCPCTRRPPRLTVRPLGSSGVRVPACMALREHSQEAGRSGTGCGQEAGG